MNRDLETDAANKRIFQFLMHLAISNSLNIITPLILQFVLVIIILWRNHITLIILLLIFKPIVSIIILLLNLLSAFVLPLRPSSVASISSDSTARLLQAEILLLDLVSLPMLNNIL